MRWGFLGQQLKTIKDNTTDCSALNNERKMHKTLIYPR